MRVVTPLAVLVAGFVCTAPAPAAQPPTFRAESELVVLHVSVRDRGGRHVAGLERDAFVVIDDGQPQQIEMFSADEVPASVGFLIDNSNSMRPSRERVIASAVEFARHSHPRDEIFVLTFNEAVRHAWGPSIAGHTDLGQFASAMSQAVVARGMTAIYDGLLAGLQRLRHGAHARQVLIVVSDGGDNASTATRDRVVAAVQESDATIYTVILTDPLIRGGNPRLLRRLASATGGEAFQPRRAADLSGAFARITDDIRHAYTLAYTPRRAAGAEAGQGRHRRVRVYVRTTDGRAVRVRTRDGYVERGSGTR